MRILHLVNHCERGHGNVHAAVDLACIQAANGHDVAYASAGGDFVPLLEAEKVRHHELHQQLRAPLRALSSVTGLRRLIGEHRAEIVHAHMMSGGLLGYLATRFTQVPLVTTVHNSFDWHSTVMRLGEVAVAVSEAERRALVGRGFRPDRTVAILNGPLGGARSRHDASTAEVAVRGPSITTVCGLHRRKGVDVLIRAFARIAGGRAAELHIVGDGPDMALLRGMAQATGFGDRITFHGGLTDPGSVLRHSDIFVLASHAEPFGLVNIEARAAGCALVLSNVGGHLEAIEGGRCGRLFPAGDDAALAVQLEELLGDAAEIARLKAASLVGIDRFTADRAHRDYLAAYQRAILARGPSTKSA